MPEGNNLAGALVDYSWQTIEKYGLWLAYDACNLVFPFPVLPEKINVKTGTKIESVSVAGLGEIVIKNGRPAITVSFSSFFPAFAFHGVPQWSLNDPLKIVQMLQEWMELKVPLRFASTACFINLYVIIESFNYYEQGGDVKTIYFDMTLKEFRVVQTREIDLSQFYPVQQQEEVRVDSSVQPRTYTVVPGDCLWAIARRFYGDGSQYTKIYEANKEVIGGNPNLIYAGQVYVIP